MTMYVHRSDVSERTLPRTAYNEWNFQSVTIFYPSRKGRYSSSAEGQKLFYCAQGSGANHTSIDI